MVTSYFLTKFENMKYVKLFLLLLLPLSFKASEATLHSSLSLIESHEPPPYPLMEQSRHKPLPKINNEDLYWLSKTMMSEIVDKNRTEELELIGVTILNLTRRNNESIKATVTRKVRPGVSAFSGVQKNRAWYMEPTEVHKSIAKKLLREGVSEDQRDLWAFCNCESPVVSKRTRAWFNTLPLYKKIKNVSFYEYPSN